MKKICFPFAIVALAVLLICTASVFSGEFETVQLLKPQIDRGRPLMRVLKDRSSSRSFSSEKLPLQVLSNLLWAAFGVNRPEAGKRTAPSAMNRQEIDVYVATADGLYLYEPKANILKPVLAEDIRAMTGRQEYVKDAPLNLIYVADFSKMGDTTSEEKEFYSAADTGFIGQNVYLFCASEDLATVVRGSIDRKALAQTMKLRPDQRIILAQSVGYHKRLAMGNGSR
jgi:SagB-type dehydrogenase family enzyme